MIFPCREPAKQRPTQVHFLNEGENLKMRSDLVFGALTHVKNRYELCQLASRATRKLHKPNTRVQETMNDVLVRFHSEDPAAHTSEAPAVQQAVEMPSMRRAA